MQRRCRNCGTAGGAKRNSGNGQCVVAPYGVCTDRKTGIPQHSKAFLISYVPYIILYNVIYWRKHHITILCTLNLIFTHPLSLPGDNQWVTKYAQYSAYKDGFNKVLQKSFLSPRHIHRTFHPTGRMSDTATMLNPSNTVIRQCVQNLSNRVERILLQHKIHNTFPTSQGTQLSQIGQGQFWSKS